MNLFGKKEKCIHHWHYVGKATVYSSNGCDVDADEMNALFCPKCEAETTVSDERWAQLQAIQKVREAYQQGSSYIQEDATKTTVKPSTRGTRNRGAVHA